MISWRGCYEAQKLLSKLDRSDFDTICVEVEAIGTSTQPA